MTFDVEMTCDNLVLFPGFSIKMSLECFFIISEWAQSVSAVVSALVFGCHGRGTSLEHQGKGTSLEHQGSGTSLEHRGRGTSLEHQGRGTSLEHKGRGTSLEHQGRGTSLEHQGSGTSLEHQGRGTSLEHQGSGTSLERQGRGTSPGWRITGLCFFSWPFDTIGQISCYWASTGSRELCVRRMADVPSRAVGCWLCWLLPYWTSLRQFSYRHPYLLKCLIPPVMS